MRIRIVKDTKCGGASVKAGAIVDASANDAQLLLSIGKAEKLPDQSEAAAPRDEVENRAISRQSMNRRRKA